MIQDIIAISIGLVIIFFGVRSIRKNMKKGGCNCSSSKTCGKPTPNK